MHSNKFPYNSRVKTLTAAGSIVSTAFGLWHFFVPEIWDWYSYIEPGARELVIAVRAINFFFSLLLVLLGTANIVLVYRRYPDQLSAVVFLTVSAILWLTRVILQLVYPQGSEMKLLQYSMLIVFLSVFFCFASSLLFILKRQPVQFQDTQ